MQATLYVPGVFYYQRRRIEEQLFAIAPCTMSTCIYDCQEFGLCLLRVRIGSKPGWDCEWFCKQQAGRARKPRIAVIVRAAIHDANLRKCWYFALSKLGYLYCVAYETQSKVDKSWKIVDWYRSWAEPKTSSNLRSADVEVPEDWVYRVAEEKLREKRKHK